MQNIFTYRNKIFDNFLPKPKRNEYFLLNVLIPIRAAFFLYEAVQTGRFQVARLTVIWNGYFTKKGKSFGRIIPVILNKVQKILYAIVTAFCTCHVF